MLVLGIDPGTAKTGYGLVKHEAGQLTIVDYGIISTKANTDMALRLCKINKELNELIKKYSPDAVAVEEVFIQKNTKTVITVAQGRGVILMTAASSGIEVAEYTPLQVKQSVVGYGRADKKQVQFMVQKILKMTEIPKPDDAADALAIAICHIHAHKIRNIYKGGN
ncbi:MAG TPA: crossover junction endodeoxyribonuclease RuvC [Syntrophomonadaceae bacterium]|nr:crossover junction endodeoxyribonuclease RuvC [Syntrophomonadaceae bacterium]